MTPLSETVCLARCGATSCGRRKPAPRKSRQLVHGSLLNTDRTRTHLTYWTAMSGAAPPPSRPRTRSSGSGPPDPACPPCVYVGSTRVIDVPCVTDHVPFTPVMRPRTHVLAAKATVRRGGGVFGALVRCTGVYVRAAVAVDTLRSLLHDGVLLRAAPLFSRAHCSLGTKPRLDTSSASACRATAALFRNGRARAHNMCGRARALFT